MNRIIFITVSACCCLAAAKAQWTPETCRELARDNYPLIKQYGLVSRSAEYSIANAAKAWLPQVAFSAQATYQSDVAEFPERMKNMFGQLGVEMKGLNRDQYRVGLEVRQAIWDGGASGVQKSMSRAEEAVSLQSIETEIYAIYERVDQLFFGILLIDEQVQLNELLLALLRSNYETVEAHATNGTATESDRDAIAVELLTVKQQRAMLESAGRAYRQMLSAMTGKEIGETEEFKKPEPAELAPPANIRPELRLFDAQTAMFETRKLAVKATTAPRMELFAQGFYGNPGLNLFKDMTENRWTLNYIAGVRLLWNIGGFYTRKGDLQKLSLAQRQVESRRETYLFNNRLQQLDKQNAIQKMRQVMADDDEIVRLRASIRQSSEARLRNGTITASDLLRDISAESQARLNRSIHETEWLKSYYELKLIDPAAPVNFGK